MVSVQGWIITNRHVVISPDNGQPYGAVQVSFKSRNRQVPADIKFCDSGEIDLCLLKIAETDAKGFGIAPPQTSCRTITTDDNLTSVGWPADPKSDQDMVPGKITGNLGSFGAYPTTLPLIHGMSGGPVYDETGIVIGVNLGALKDDPTRTFILPYAYARTILFKSTVPACEQPSTKTDLTLALRVSKTTNVPIKKLQDAGETTKLYSVSYSADAGYKIAKLTLSLPHCNGCVTSDPTVLNGGTSGSFTYTLRGSAGYIEGTIQLKQERYLQESLSLPNPIKTGWNLSVQLPPEIITVEISRIVKLGWPIYWRDVNTWQHSTIGSADKSKLVAVEPLAPSLGWAELSDRDAANLDHSDLSLDDVHLWGDLRPNVLL